jgi:hypothetical protein
VVGAVALVAGAALAVAGSPLPLFEQVLTFSADEERYSMTLWGVESTFDIRASSEQPHLGVPVVVAAALLVVVAALVLAAPRLPARFAGPTSLGAMGAAALLLGSVWTVGQFVLVATSNQNTEEVRSAVGTGTVLLGLACLVALTGGLLVQHWPDEVPAAPKADHGGAVVYRLPDEDDADTPPFGIPATEDAGGGA